ncbi:cysteine hydrolase family protein [Anaerotignum sp. MB30-C6]|uniref:cysteine hydrolase family protein n=1 Tax=Anaerotignum sp. MB30-C6 TaxID=3070814 RepID=UPI0027DDEF8F|nr:isochorismatase family cysteine hydrolase [Anaerotignum sp. MB30-C6]WMI80188.1 isochorismatase family cysteine hydrolase [Anaerotignum sp. MB30-C6]
MKKVLIVIDMQKDFIDGSLGTKEAEEIVDCVLNKISQYPKENIIATRDTHEENYLETQEGEKLPVVHCVRGTEGWQLDKRIAQALEVVPVIDKPTFGSVELVELLYNEWVKEELEVELVGLCTDICVVSNAILLKARMPEMKISVDSACCAGVTPETHKAALTTLAMCHVTVK